MTIVAQTQSITHIDKLKDKIFVSLLPAAASDQQTAHLRRLTAMAEGRNTELKIAFFDLGALATSVVHKHTKGADNIDARELWGYRETLSSKVTLKDPAMH